MLLWYPIVFFAFFKALRNAFPMKLEILHDTLAKQVYEKASTEDKMRLKVATFVKSRYTTYKAHGGLLNSEDLNYIQPYLKGLDFSPGINTFIRRSRWKSRIRILSIALLVIIAFILLILYGMRSNQLAESKVRNSERLKENLAELQKLNDSYKTEKRKRDSLEQQVENTESLLAMTKEEVAEIARQLEVKNKELNEANAKLKGEKKELVKKKDKIQSEYNRSVQVQKKQQQELSVAEQREQKLITEYVAAEARGALASDNRELAFRLARAAIERDPNAEEAQQVLFHLEKPSASYPYKGMPPNHSSPEEIIRKLESRYGKLSLSQKRRYKLAD